MRKGIIQKRIILVISTWLKLGNTFNIENYLDVCRDFYPEWKRVANSSIKRSINSLLDQGYLYKKYNNNVLYYELSIKGKTYFKNLKAEQITIKQQKKWDKKWRILIFDIPEKYRGMRNFLRHRIKDLGFFKIQQSVFVIPSPCRKEIKTLINLLQIHEYVHLIETTYFDDDSKIKKHFGL